MKYIARSLLSTFFYLLSFFKKREGIIVLTYHRVNDDLPPSELNTPVAIFHAQAKYLKKHCKVVSVTELINPENRIKLIYNQQKPVVVITFDDGYRDNYLNAHPILKELNLSACIFLATDRIGTNYKAQRFVQMPDPDMLNWQEVKKMAEGEITFGNHTATHLHLSQLTKSQQKEEILKGIAILRQHLNSEIDQKIFCYPYGDYNQDTLEILKEIGCGVAFTIKPGINTEETPALEMQRIEISGFDNLFDFRKKIAGAFEWMHKQVQKRKELKRETNNKRHKANTKINILHVIWSLGLGGGEQALIHLIRGTNKDKYRLFLCCLNDEGEFADSVRDSVVKIFALNKKRGIDFSIIGRIMKIIRGNDIHIVHTHMWGGNFWGRIAAKLTNTPVTIATEQNVDFWKKWYQKMFDRILSRVTDKVIVVSKEVKKFYANIVGIPISKMEVIYNCVPPSEKITNKTHIQAIRDELNMRNADPVIVNIGRLVPQKANHIFIEALRMLDLKDIDFNAFIIGEGPLKESLIRQGQDLIDKHKLTFTGLRKDVPRILDVADISVLSSITEGLSVAICECMEKRIPVIATDVGGNGEQVVNGETGYLVPPDNATALADTMEKLIKDPVLAKKMGETGHKRVRRHFSIDRMVKSTECLYQSLEYNCKVRT
ncbi:MAG: glycosyltransferase [Candidatus Omnitrophica bacterium]|nr:glycosyltransferase [Candidatus Omnitrophota bacterium]